MTKEENKLKHREWQRKYKLTAKGKLTEHRYEVSVKGRAVHTKWRQANQFKIIAHRMVRDALRSGKIFRQQCEICGKENAYGHHDDYNNPLELRWFCNLHHMQYHKRKR